MNSKKKLKAILLSAGIGSRLMPLTKDKPKCLMKIGNKHNLYIVEDNAHGIYGEYRGKKLGSIGHISTFSFHKTKNISCGEGGAIVLNKPNLFDRAEIIREKGTNRKKFYRGLVDKYTWVDIGSSYLPSDILSAYLFAQLENLSLIHI